MKCTNCGQELPEGAAFCPGCGARAGSGAQPADGPIYTAEVKGWLKSGGLAVYRDRVEFSTSSAQKTVFNYDCLVAVKKRLLPSPAILFITEDARTEACAATSKNIHEAFLYVEQAVRPYLEARRARLLAQGVRYSLLSSVGLGSSGILDLLDDRAEFRARSGQREVIPFEAVRSVALSAGNLSFILFDRRARSFALDKELREEVLAFVRQAVAPYLEERKQALLARGIYYSIPGGLGQQGEVDLYADRVEFAGCTGGAPSVSFGEVRAAGLRGDLIELLLTDGSARAIAVDPGEQGEILAFVQKAIEPYVERRTVGFETGFGAVDRIEFNLGRGVFHLLRQNGAVITEEYPMADLLRCELQESTDLNLMLSGIRMGGKALTGKGAELEEQLRAIDLLLTIRAGEGQQAESLRFGDFPLGATRSSPKYAQCAAEAAGLMEFLRSNCPGCELVIPEPPEPEPAAEEPPPLQAGDGGQTVTLAGLPGPAKAAAPLPVRGQDLAKNAKYIDRICQYIGRCQTPMTIAFQGGAGSGEGGMMKLLAGELEGQYKGRLAWLHAKQLGRSNLGEKLPLFIGAALISQLGGANDGRVVKFAKAFINLSVTLLSQGNSDGKFLIDAFFKDNQADSPEDLAGAFSELVKKKTEGGEKVLVFVDGLGGLAPAKMVEVLEAMEGFLDCEGCVFVVAVDYAAVVRGVSERYGADEARGKSFFDKTFRITFRLPAAGFQMESYVKGRLDQLGLPKVDEGEIGLYCGLLEHSVGGRPESIDHLFDSFELLKTLADENIYEESTSRLILFGLLCMQARFSGVYRWLSQQKDAVTPALLLELCGRPDGTACPGLEEGDWEAFEGFAQLLCGVVNTDGEGGISQPESGLFAQVLEFASITSV